MIDPLRRWREYVLEILTGIASKRVKG